MANHGTRTAYKDGCRCTDCRAAHAEYARERRKRQKPPSHGASGYFNHGCRCGVCSEAGRVANRERWQKIKDGQYNVSHGTTGRYAAGCRCEVCVTAANERNNESFRQANERSRSRAGNHRKEWTGPELELLTRTDLGASELAEMLGRTVRAVRSMRQKVRTQPRESWLAGVRVTDDA